MKLKILLTLLVSLWLSANIFAQNHTQSITAIQYYFNADPGIGVIGNGAIIPVSSTSNFNQTLSITVPASLNPGIHNLYVRACDEFGKWSLVERRLFYINDPALASQEVDMYQYYFDNDPGVGIAGNGAVVPISPTANFNQSLSITVPGSLTTGFHNLYVRTRDLLGRWSLIERRLFYINSTQDAQDLVAYQYYFDTDPGVGVAGNGAVVPFSQTGNFNQQVAITIPGTLSKGLHNLYVRTKDNSGRWSLIERRLFYISTDNTILPDVSALEYYFDNDPGVGNGNPYPITTGANINITAAIGVPCLSTGTHYLYVRAKNAEGKWSIIERDTLNITSGIAASVITPTGPVNICTGNSVVLSSTQVAGATYQWLLNNVVIPGATTTSYSANAAGSYTLRTTCGASFTVSNAVVVNTLPLLTYYADADNDGYGNAAEDSLACSLPSGYVTNNTDCNDANAAISPGDLEVCNGIDDNCNSLIDDGLTFLTYYVDGDGDGYGSINDPGVSSCVAISGAVTNNTDCKDSNGAINPGASESCNGIDDNCNSQIDEGVTTTFYADADGDGFGATAGSIQACTAPPGYVLIAGDCNDANNAVNPNATEVCNGIDDDCDTQIDEGVTITYYADSDGDGFGDAASPTQACTQPGGYVANDTDCDDNNNAINTPVFYYVDADNDGYGSSATSSICSLTPPVGYSTNDDDCDDNNPSINPGLQEVCNGVDDDCDGLTDDADPSVTGQPMWYADTDNDTFGDAANTLQACVQPPGYVSNNTDCDDSDNLINSSILYFVDTDQDGYGSPITTMLCSLTAPIGYSTNNLDCNDGNANVNPGETEVCNGIDDNCNGSTDEGVTITFYADADGDGYGNPTNTTQACSLPVGYSLNNLDCNDTDALEFPGQTWYTDADGDDYGSGASLVQCTRPINGFVTTELIATSGDCADANAAINPGATETCNGIDDDCDTEIDEGVLITYYADADGDTYGDPAVSQLACTQPIGYVINNMDCNDADNQQFPGQVWYTDADGDDYGTGATVTQCLRPATGYLAGELISTIGDCNDNNASINPVSQTLTFSTTSNFQSSLINPASGTSYTTFTFEVVYTDATNSLPPATFPRVLLDYEGNGVFNNANDRVVIMNEYDVNDLNTSDGKRYIGTINSLTPGTNWQTRIQIVNGACITQTGPFNYPDVLILPDLQIFANDITFSSPNPDVSSPQTVTAVIHNTSDFPAQNFYVHLVNQYDNSSPADILVSNLAPHSSTTVSWTITTPAVPAWCPMQVSIDYTNVIDESNELDNSALRPFINGNFNLPGGIVVINAASSPSVFYSSTGGSTTISGRALYYGTPVPMADSSVAGGTVSITIVETGATFTANTNSQGYFSIATPAPYGIGTYNVSGSVTDFTLTGNFTTSYTIISPPACLPDLRAFIALSSGSIIAGNSISGSITVYNYGCLATTINSVLDISHSGGTPVLNDVTIPPLNPGASFTTSFSNLSFANAGTYSLCATADGTHLIQESNEGNNTECRNVTVIPAMADIYPAGGPSGNGYSCNESGIAQFTVGNSGGAPTGPFNCEVIVKFNNVVVNTFTHLINNIAIQSSTTFTIPGTYNSTGIHTFEIKCDIPLPVGVVTETNEFNNTAQYTRNMLPCKPDLAFTSCESFDVQPMNPQFPGSVTYVATMVNSGNATANGPIDVRFELSGGTFYDTQYNGNLTPGQSTVVSVNAPSVAPATQTLSAIADPANTIEEFSESNTITKSLCWDFKPVPMYYPCGVNFWQQTYLVNQTAFLSVGMTANNLYDASNVKVRFQVSGPGLSGTVTLGDATVNNVEETCNCPRNAVLPVSFAFPQVGTYTFTMTADPDSEYSECNENDNVMVVNVIVTAVPDMRILSQYIDPSMLNPQPGQSITMDITYENLGVSNITDQMELRVLVDEIPLDSVYPVNGLVSGDNITIAIPQTWSSNAPGTHVIRAIIDSDNQVVESNESNNQATRAIIVGEAANLYFQAFESSDPTPALHDNISINATIGNNGDLDCGADIQFFYLTNSLDTIHIGTIPVNVTDNSSTNISLPWNVLDPTTTLLGKIINSSTLEFTYDDNQASTVIGAMTLSFTSTQSCNGGNDGTLTAVPSGGEAPYSYTWSNGYNGNTQTGAAGSYSVTVTDNTGQFVSGSGTITNDAGVLYFADADGDTYGDAAVSQVSCSGPPTGYVENDDDCDDNSAAVNPGATEVCNSIDDDCDGLIDNNDPSLSDTELPTISCVANIAVNNDVDACGAQINYALPIFSDNCSGATIAQTTGLASGSFFPVGTTTNTYVVTDFSGNTATCSFDIVVTDTQNPSIACPGDISLIATGPGGAIVNYSTPVGTDNCSGSTITMTTGFASGSTFPIGITTVTYVVTDAAGLTATCSFTVDVTGLPPQIACPSNITTISDAGQCGAIVSFVATETTGIPASTITYSHAPGSFFDVGTTTVTATATNSVGTSVCTFDIIVNDEEDPTLNVPNDIIIPNDANACNAVVTYTTSFDDNCSGSTIAQTAGLASGSSFPVGTTTNTFVVTDASGNTATATFTVTVIDNTNPTITCPANIVTTNDAGECGATINYTVPFSDNCSGSTIAQTSGIASGSQFPIGTTTNTFVVTDASGNTATCSFTITINDEETPTLIVPVDIIVPNDANACNAVVTYTTSFYDNCSGATIAQTAGMASGSTFPVGTTTNTFVVTDASGNTATGSFTVTVIDNTNPVISCPADIYVSTSDINGTVVTYVAPAGTDNCSGATTILLSGLPSGSMFSVGSTTVTYQVTDAAGNTSTCSFVVTVSFGGLLPQIVCPANIVVNANNGQCGKNVNFAATETMGIPASTISYSHAPGSWFDVGTTTVTATATNSVGTSVCSFDVTVIDNQLPTILCPSNMSAAVNTSGCFAVVNYSAPVFADNCSGATITQTAGLPSGSLFPKGVTTNTFVVTDASGNTATCSFNINVTNSVPVVTSVSSSAGPIFPVNTATTLTAMWTDEPAGGPYTVTFIWNDGTANTVLTGINGFMASASHTYIGSAVFEPSIRVTDACGNQSVVVSGVSTYQYLAVYVVGSQFTTMGGWYNTPAGSLMSNPSFNGKVNMGNVVKPINGAFKGELELNIKDQNIKVHAVNPTTWDYLTITGCCFAQFRGDCKINNVTGYKVLVAQTDHNYSCYSYGGNNMIRVKVWNATTGQIIYDTQPGAPDNAIPTLSLNGGSIQVHTQGNCNARLEAPDFDVKCYPNPAKDLLNIDVISDQDQNIKMQMFDVTGRIVYENEMQAVVGSNNTLVDVNGMNRGVYFVEINSAAGIRRMKVVLD